MGHTSRNNHTLDNAENSPLATYCNDIVDGKRKLVKAELTFSTGERLTFEGNGDRWTKIQVSDAKIELMVPEQTIKKIPVIHFASVALLWDGRDEKAFTASYFYIQFDIGTDKFFNEYPELNLSFPQRNSQMQQFGDRRVRIPDNGRTSDGTTHNNMYGQLRGGVRVRILEFQTAFSNG